MTETVTALETNIVVTGSEGVHLREHVESERPSTMAEAAKRSNTGLLQ